MTFFTVLIILIIIIAVSMLVLRSHIDLEGYWDTNVLIPKIIWTFWDGGEMPNIVKKCLNQYAVHNPDYKIIVLNKSNVSKYIDFDIDKLVHNDSIQRFSDFVRISVLSKHGGIWTDASIICTQSLSWVHKAQTPFVGFYIASFTKIKESPVIENWWFACAPGCQFMKAWRDEFMTINNYPTVKQYLEKVASEGIRYDGFIDLAEYLAMHVACQVVLQKNPRFLRQMTLYQAEKTAFAYLVQHGWDSQPAVKSLCTIKKEEKPVIIKLRGAERDLLDKEPDSCLANLFTEQPKVQ